MLSTSRCTEAAFLRAFYSLIIPIVSATTIVWSTKNNNKGVDTTGQHVTHLNMLEKLYVNWRMLAYSLLVVYFYFCTQYLCRALTTRERAIVFRHRHALYRAIYAF